MLDHVTSRGKFQPQSSCDFAIHLMFKSNFGAMLTVQINPVTFSFFLMVTALNGLNVSGIQYSVIGFVQLIKHGGFIM